MEIIKDNKIYGKNGYLESHEITIDLKKDGKGNILGDAIYTIVCADALYNISTSPMDEITMLRVESRLEFAIGLLQKELNKIR